MRACRRAGVAGGERRRGHKRFREFESNSRIYTWSTSFSQEQTRRGGRVGVEERDEGSENRSAGGAGVRGGRSTCHTTGRERLCHPIWEAGSNDSTSEEVRMCTHQTGRHPTSARERETHVHVSQFLVAC